MKKRHSKGGVEKAGEGDDTVVLLLGQEQSRGGGGRGSNQIYKYF